MGSMSLDLDIAPGVMIDTVSWTISNPAGYSRSGMGLKLLDCLERQTAPGCLVYEETGERMFAGLLGGGSQAQEFVR